MCENFTKWCHCIINYYEQFELFVIRNDLYLNLTLRNASPCTLHPPDNTLLPHPTRTIRFADTLHPYYPT